MPGLDSQSEVLMNEDDCTRGPEEGKTGLQTDIHISRRALNIPPFLVMEVLERAMELERHGRSVIHLEVGEPDFDTPAVIGEAGIRAIRDGHTHYTHSLGLLELRLAIARWQKRQYGIDVDPGCVVVTSGSSPAMLLVFAALLNEGDSVIIPDPGYACYSKFVHAVSGKAVSVRVDEADGFHYRAERVRAALTPTTRAVMVNSPSNPSGTLATPEQMRLLAGELPAGTLIVSDEIYHGLVYGERAHSILEFTDQAVVINGFSKLFAMTGWRLGYAILPPPLVRPVQKLQQNLFISAPDFAQHAAVAALDSADDAVEAMRSEYDRRRRFLLSRLKAIGLRVLVEPRGAFYVFVNVSQFTDNVYEFAFQILEEAGVAVTPGTDFGSFGEGFIRLCYANSMENLSEGMNRLEAFLQRLG